MKRILFFLLLAVVVIHCKKDDDSHPLTDCNDVTDSLPDDSMAVYIPSVNIDGLNVGLYLDGQDPADGLLLPPEQIEARLKQLKGFTKCVRFFSSDNGHQQASAIAKQLDLEAYASAWLSSDLAANETEIANLIEIGKSGNAKALIVGSEVLLRGDLSPQQLIDYINAVKAAVPTLPVTTADTYDRLIANPEVREICDFLFVNIYPFWEGEGIQCAIYRLHHDWQLLKNVSGDKEIVLSESGWPSDGNSIGSAAPTPANQCLYVAQLVAWGQAMGIKIFVFQAMDEPWKANHEGELGAHWGIFDKDGKLKDCMRDLFDGKTIACYSECPAFGSGTMPPVLTFVSVPPIGSNANLKGSVAGVNPVEHIVAVYIKVGGQWWVKPYSASRKIPIDEHGCWVVDITTGGSDPNATEIAAFLLPAGYDPPNVLGAGVLPAGLVGDAVAKVFVVR
ncbi:MAG: hypothetical protein HUU34_01100 [Saprospiraceae bacterium]|nr:hypothetical protein [Saprospiraceae bacterium]